MVPPEAPPGDETVATRRQGGIPIIRTKLHRPPVNDQLVGRKRLHDFLVNMAEVKKEDDAGTVEDTIEKAKAAFTKALDDDLNISAALGVVFDFVIDINRAHPGKREAALAADALRSRRRY